MITDEFLKRAAEHANKEHGLMSCDNDVALARQALGRPARQTDVWGESVRAFVAESNRGDDFDRYQQIAMSMAFYPGRGEGNLSYPMLGLCGEAGEAAEKWKKALRDDGGQLTDDRREALKKELGDVLWYVTACAQEAGFALREVAEANLKKLTDRAQRGKLGGSGDER